MRIKSLLPACAAGLIVTLVATACSSGGSSSTSPTTAVAVPLVSSGSSTVVTTTAAPAVTTTTGVTTSASSSTTGPVTTAAGGVDPNAPEVVEPGDIPDNQVFVAYSPPGATFSVKVPEGWAQTDQQGATVFSDNYNSITIESMPASAPPTIDSVTASGLTDASSDSTFTLIDVTAVTRKAGDGVLATYEIGSAANPVTGKKALLAVERYFFFHNGTEVTLTLSGAKGADNVDPWKTVTNSLTWI
jgi:hypothetical protein